MIDRIKLRYGAKNSTSYLEFVPGPITIFVGPNNSGKSKVLTEIQRVCSTGTNIYGDNILDGVEFQASSPEQAAQILDELSDTPPPGAVMQPSHVLIKGRQRHNVNRHFFLRALENPNSEDRQMFAQAFMSTKTLMLSGDARINLINEQKAGDLQQPPSNTFQRLFHDDLLRQRLSDLVHDALGMYLIIDPTNVGNLRLRLSRTAPPSVEVERGLTKASVDFHASATLVQMASDGAKAFVGILAEILAGDPGILLIDEPEAFLHPSLSFALGREIAATLASTEKRMFVATHSPQFVMGCIQSGVPINVIRLTYNAGQSTARLLPSKDLIKLMRNPLLRSTGVLSALFYESVVVTEGDADRVFYQEINERLLRGVGKQGIQNCIFLNAQNKQTIPTILRPLRELGIPSAAIYDVDIFKEGGCVHSNYLESAGIPGPIQYSMANLRASVFAALQRNDPAFKRNGGIEVLTGEDKASAIHYIEQLEGFGGFVVRGGELECWLRDLGVKGHGPTWLIPMLERLGEDPSATTYIHAAKGDVWGFLERVRLWLTDPHRKGIPSS